MQDIGKHYCAAAKTDASCALVKDSANKSACVFMDMCYDPCAHCQACLDAANTVLLPSILKDDSAVAIRSKFYKWCIQEGFNTSFCNIVGDQIQGSVNGNQGKRAGAICSMLGSCNASSASTDSCSYKASYMQLAGGLDLCVREGITGGLEVLPEGSISKTEALAKNVCIHDGDCKTPGHVCNTEESYRYTVCECTNGLYKCQLHGTCTNYCNVPSVEKQLAILNNLVS